MIWVIGTIVGALVASMGLAANSATTERKKVLDLTISNLQGTLGRSDMEELKDMRRSVDKGSLNARVVFTCMWLGGIVLFGVSLYMLTH